MQLRDANFQKLTGRTFDVLIVGGGINGSVSAAALAAQGGSVALIDKGDFAGFTSQESSNLVWGGIKYLEGGEIGLVRKLCRSRNRLLRSYPSSVREIRFFTSIEKGFRHGRLKLFLGTLLYWAIGGFFTRAPRLLSKLGIGKEEPLVAVNGPGGFEYSDAYLVDNDARFVFNFVRSALDYGTIAVNYACSLGSSWQDEGIWHTRVRDEIDRREVIVRSRALVNAAGPHVDAHNAQSGEKTAHRHVFSKGVHLIVDRITRSERVLTFFADDGRLFFVIPLGPKSCIGTTDTRITELPPKVDPEDRRFILENVNKRLKLEKPLTEDDIIAERCGARPLVVESSGSEDGRDWTSLSRKHAIDVNREHKHVSIYGGKLTDCLNVGREVTATLRRLGIELPHYGRHWYGEPPDAVRDEFFHRCKLMHLDALTARDAFEPLSTRLWRRYGASAFPLLDEIRQDPRMAQVLIRGTEYIRCELHYAAKRELVVKLEDFLRRRSKIALIAKADRIRHAAGLIEACEILFGPQAQDKIEEYFAPQRGA